MASTRRRTAQRLFILSDDQGAWALRCAGNPEISTPALDRLAAERHSLRKFLLHVAGVLAGARLAVDRRHTVPGTACTTRSEREA